MPLRKYMKKRTTKKPSMAKAKAMVSKSKKRAKSKNMDTFYLAAKTVALITPSQGGTVSNYVSWWIQLLTATTNVGVSQNAEFNLYRTMYDQVRVNSVSIKIVPKANVLDQRQAQNDALVNNSGDGLIHTAIDRDDQPPANIARLTRYPSYKKYSVLRKFARSYSVKYPDGIWLDCQNIYSDDTLLTRLGLTGGIYLYAENILEDNSEIVNEPWAQVEITYGCVFRGKTSTNLSYDAVTGAVTMTPTQPGQIMANTPVTALYGTIKDDVRTDKYGDVAPVVDTDIA